MGTVKRQIIDGRALCYTCKMMLPVDEFNACRAKACGLQSHCKSCFKARRSKDRADINARQKRWREANKDKVNFWFRAYKCRRLQEDTQYRIACNLRTRLSNAVRRQGGLRGASAIRDLGCTIEEFVRYMESQFRPGMSWDNYGEWHIDHIRPLMRFDLSNVDECRAANNYMNLQPLWAAENIAKGDR